MRKGSKTRRETARQIGIAFEGLAWPASYLGKQGLFIKAEDFTLLKSRFLKES